MHNRKDVYAVITNPIDNTIRHLDQLSHVRRIVFWDRSTRLWIQPNLFRPTSDAIHHSQGVLVRVA
jgi:hypothetical protein